MYAPSLTTDKPLEEGVQEITNLDAGTGQSSHHEQISDKNNENQLNITKRSMSLDDTTSKVKFTIADLSPIARYFFS